MDTKEKSNVCSIIALVLGIASIVICALGYVFGIAGVILSIIALAVRKEEKRGIAIAGLVTSIVGILLGIAILVSGFFLTQYVRREVARQLGITEEQVEILSEFFTPAQIEEYTTLYQQYEAGELNPEDVTLESLGLENHEFTQEEVDAIKDAAAGLGVTEEEVLSAAEKIGIDQEVIDKYFK